MATGYIEDQKVFSTKGPGKTVFKNGHLRNDGDIHGTYGNLTLQKEKVQIGTKLDDRYIYISF